MDKGDKLEKKIEESIESIKNNLNKVNTLEKVLENITSEEKEA